MIFSMPFVDEPRCRMRFARVRCIKAEAPKDYRPAASAMRRRIRRCPKTKLHPRMRKKRSMTTTIISDNDDLLNWMYAPRNGLTTREIGAVIRVRPRDIRDSIRRGDLAGVRLQADGRVFAYAATVDDAAAFYELSEEAANCLRTALDDDATDTYLTIGQLTTHTGDEPRIETEFESAEEFRSENPKTD